MARVRVRHGCGVGFRDGAAHPPLISNRGRAREGRWFGGGTAGCGAEFLLTFWKGRASSDGVAAPSIRAVGGLTPPPEIVRPRRAPPPGKQRLFSRPRFLAAPDNPGLGTRGVQERGRGGGRRSTHQDVERRHRFRSDQDAAITDIGFR